MAKYWTYLEITTKIDRDMDLEAEDFIQPDELQDLVNEAIDEAEATIHTLGLEDDYFLTYVDKDITQGESLIDLPSDIYAHKIRNVVYSESNIGGNLIYSVKRFRGMRHFEKIAEAQHFTNSGDYYRYQIVNDNSDSGATPAPKLLFVPSFRKTASGVLRIWYIRNAHRLSADTDVCDIPEFVHFIIKHVKHAVYSKEGHPNTPNAKAELEQSRKRMEDTLSTMIPDEDSEVVPDMRFYEETT